MSCILSDTENAVLQTITMRLNTKEALSYLMNFGFKMSRRTYFRHKKRLESLKWKRLVNIVNYFTDLHLQSVDKLELIEGLMWREYHNEKAPSKRVSIFV